MIERGKLESIADQIKDYFLTINSEEYYKNTGVLESDFKPIINTGDFKGDIFAIDGSNVIIFSLGKNSTLNYIRAGYVVYQGTHWKKTAIIYECTFLANISDYKQQFEKSILEEFNIKKQFSLKDTELDRLSTYFRDLQEYIALSDAIKNANKGDLILYDGGFAYWKDPYYNGVLNSIFEQARNKGIDLLGISKSTKLSWDYNLSKSPFLQNTSYIGSQVISSTPWYLELTNNKKIIRESWDTWDGRTYIVKFHQNSEYAFRVDAPPDTADHIEDALDHAVGHSYSAECLGYPHALFRAHREIRISSQEKSLLIHLLFDRLNGMGINEKQIRRILLDQHNILEMKPRMRL